MKIEANKERRPVINEKMSREIFKALCYLTGKLSEQAETNSMATIQLMELKTEVIDMDDAADREFMKWEMKHGLLECTLCNNLATVISDGVPLCEGCARQIDRGQLDI